MEQNNKHTRIAKWAKYRESIYSNIELHKEVIASNERLSLLYKRLIKVFPKYESIFSTEKKHQFKFEQPSKVLKYNLEKIQTIINKLDVEDQAVDLRYLEKTIFSTGELDTIINDLESWTPRGSENVNLKTDKLQINTSKKVTL